MRRQLERHLALAPASQRSIQHPPLPQCHPRSSSLSFSGSSHPLRTRPVPGDTDGISIPTKLREAGVDRSDGSPAVGEASEELKRALFPPL